MNRKIEDSLRRAADALPQADYAAIRDADVAPMEKHDYITRQEESKHKRPLRRLALAAACLVCLVAVALGGGWYWQYGMVDAIVDIDLNPSYDITVNRQGQVLDIIPMNEEAERVLEGRNYRGWAIEEAVFTLFSDLPSHGFMAEGEPTVLVSVSGRNEERAAALGEQVSQTIGYSALGSPVSPTVVTQTYAHSQTLQQKAAEYGISPGKMYIVYALLEQGAPYNEAQLAAMNIEELVALAHGYGLAGLVDHFYPSTAPPQAQPEPPAVSSPSLPPSSSSSAPAVPVPQPSSPSQLPLPPAPTGDSPYDDSPYEPDDDADDDSPYETDDDDDD